MRLTNSTALQFTAETLTELADECQFSEVGLYLEAGHPETLQLISAAGSQATLDYEVCITQESSWPRLDSLAERQEPIWLSNGSVDRQGRLLGWPIVSEDGRSGLLVARLQDGESDVSNLQRRLLKWTTKQLVMVEGALDSMAQSVERERARLKAISNVTARVNQDLSRDALLDRVIEFATEVVEADASAVFVVARPPEDGELREVGPGLISKEFAFANFEEIEVGAELDSSLHVCCLCSSGLPSTYLREVERTFPDFPSLRVLESGEALYLRDIENGGLKFDLRKLLLREGFRTVLLVPLRRKEKVFGALVLYHNEVTDYTRSDLELVQAVADHTALALKNAQLLQQTMTANEQLGDSLSKLKATQNKLIHSEKMMAIGRLISGIAHELNNPLTAILGYSQLLDDSSRSRERVERCVGKISQEAERCQKIVQSLLTFARVRSPEYSAVNLNDIVSSALDLRVYELRVNNIEVDTEFGDVGYTMGDFHQLQQVIFNLIINAEQAIRSNADGGRLDIRTYRETHDEGQFVVFELRDDGPGIPQDILPRIFEPFYTTKADDEGTGLGLSVSYGIIQDHDGYISADNMADGGARFRIELPVVNIDRPREEAEDAGDGQTPPTPMGQRVLVVDDEEPIIEMLYEVLQMAGFHVLTATSGEMALDQLETEEVDLIISDLMMPGVGGQELFESVSAQYPELARRFIFITGDIVARHNQELLDDLECPYLIKPFKVRKLVGLVGEVLESSGADEG